MLLQWVNNNTFNSSNFQAKDEKVMHFQWGHYSTKGSIIIDETVVHFSLSKNVSLVLVNTNE